MKLYVYDHCPYCVRARMIFGLKKIPFELKFFLSDDFDSPESMIGKKMAPILQKQDGSYMPESLDIVHYIDNNYAGDPLITGSIASEITTIINEITVIDYKLLYPRFIKLGLPEFATSGAIDYFVTTKTKKSGAFSDCLANSSDYITRIETILTKLDGEIKSPSACNSVLSLDDICLFPILRNLTCVKNLSFPSNIKAYLATMAKLSQVDLYFDRAI